MKLKTLLNEHSIEFVKIGGVLRQLSNDEMFLYKRIKNSEDSKLYKKELNEYDQNIANKMVSKGLIKRVKSNDDSKKGRIYFTTLGRNGKLHNEPLEEVAPPDKEIESWIKKNKKRFKEKYGKDYGKYLYGKAWKDFNGSK